MNFFVVVAEHKQPVVVHTCVKARQSSCRSGSAGSDVRRKAYALDRAHFLFAP